MGETVQEVCMESQLLTLPDIMKWLKVSRPKAFELMREEGLPRIKMGSRTLRFDEKDVAKWIEERKRPA